METLITTSYIITFFAGNILSHVGNNLTINIIENHGLHPKGIGKLDRPWGLKSKEIRQIINESNDESIRVRLRRALRLRIIGLWIIFTPWVLAFLFSLLK